MDFRLTEDHEFIRKTARDFADGPTPDSGGSITSRVCLKRIGAAIAPRSVMRSMHHKDYRRTIQPRRGGWVRGEEKLLAAAGLSRAEIPTYCSWIIALLCC